MTFIIKKEYSINFSVSVTPPGSHETQEFNIEARAMSEHDLDAIIKGSTPDSADKTLCLSIISNFENIKDENNNSLPFNQDNLNKILSYPFVRKAILKHYWQELYQSRQKN